MTIDDFIQALQNLNRSEHTVKSYRRDLLNFIEFWLANFALNGHRLPAGKERMEFTDWSKIEVAHLKTYLAERTQQGAHPRTLARELSSLRSALNFFFEHGAVPRNVAKGVKAPKQPAPLPKSLDVDQTAQLLAIGESNVESKHLNEQSAQLSAEPINWQQIRDQAIFELLYSAGLRVSECAQLNEQPVRQSYQTGWVTVLGKGKKERMASVGAKAKTALKNWLEIRAHYIKAGEQALFVNKFGTRLGVRSIQYHLDQRAQQAHLPTKVSPHRLRHACATHVLESSGDLRAVQEMLGHANLSTTQIYTKLDLQHLAKVYDAAHPRAKK